MTHLNCFYKNESLVIAVTNKSKVGKNVCASENVQRLVGSRRVHMCSDSPVNLLSDKEMEDEAHDSLKKLR